MKKIALGIAIGLLVPILAAYIFLIAGGMPVATKGPPLPLEKFVVRTAMHAALKNEDTKSPPMSADETTYLAGAKIYKQNCILCHGTPGQAASTVAKGMFPEAPQLFEADEYVTDDPVGEIFWKIKNGIRLTGMPGFVDGLSETEIWQVALLLANADKLPPSVALKLKSNTN